jgi:hypothetical protein
MSAVALQGVSAPWLGLASILVLAAGCLLPSRSKASADPRQAVIHVAERVLLSAAFALVLAIMVGQISRLDLELGRIVTAPGIALAALFAGRCIGRSCKAAHFLQLSVFLGFAASVAFIAVKQGSGLAPAAAADWRSEAAVVVGASLFILLMHAGAALDRRSGKPA